MATSGENLAREEGYTIIALPGSRSKVWKFFGMKSKDGKTVEKGDMKTAFCRIEGCRKPEVGYSGNTTNLIHHLSINHPQELNMVTGGESSGRQQKISMFFGKPKTASKLPLESPRAREVTKALVNFITHDLRPVSVVDGDGFRRFVETLDPTYPVPSRSYIGEKITQHFELAKESLKKMLAELSGVGITTDLWTSRNQRSYMTVTTHFFDSDWVLHSRPLNTKEVDGSHTADRIRNALEEEVKEWGIVREDGNATKLVAIATDNAANMKAAVEPMDAPHIPCLGHTVNLAVKAGLATPRASRLRAKVKRVVEYFHRSTQAAEALRKKQQASDVSKPLRLIQDVETRWTATSDMMERALKLKDHLQSILTSSEKRDVRDMALSAEDWFEVKELCGVLTPLCESMTELCGDKYCTASMLAVILPQIRQLLTPKEEDTPVTFQFKDAAKANFGNRYTSLSFQDVINKASFLDPRCKSFFFIADDTREITKQSTVEAVKTELRKLPEISAPEKSNEPAGPEPQAKKLKGFARVLSSALSHDSPAISSTPTVTQAEIIDLEVSQYLAIEPPPVQTTPPEWWKEHALLFPRLAKLAKRLLCIPATSVPSERLFSTAGMVICQKRSNLLPENANKLIFLNKNGDLI